MSDTGLRDGFANLVPGAPVAVAMVGGRGERLRPITDSTPKPLIRVGNDRIIERIIKRLARGGVQDVWLTVHYMAELFRSELGDGEQLGSRIRYIVEEQPLGTAGALRLLPADQISGPVVVTNGDLITELDFADLLRFHADSGALMTVVGVMHTSAVPYGVLELDESGRLRDIDEKPKRTDLVNAGMYVLSPELLSVLPPLLDAPAASTLGMDQVLDIALASPAGVAVYKLDAPWHDIGSHDELERVARLYDERDNRSDSQIDWSGTVERPSA